MKKRQLLYSANSHMIPSGFEHEYIWKKQPADSMDSCWFDSISICSIIVSGVFVQYLPQSFNFSK